MKNPPAISSLSQEKFPEIQNSGYGDFNLHLLNRRERLTKCSLNIFCALVCYIWVPGRKNFQSMAARSCC